ncbi:MAG: hypothetical protein ACFBSC_09695 [Microcoleaceae cyanobacterium]
MSKWTRYWPVLLLIGSLIATKEFTALELGVMSGFILAVISKGMRRKKEKQKSSI